MSDLTPHFFRRSSSDPIDCIRVFSSFCWEAGKMQNPHAGLQCSLCSGSTTFSPTGHIVPCQPHRKVYLSLSPSQTTPLSCLCVCFSCQLDSSWCPLNWMIHPGHCLSLLPHMSLRFFLLSLWCFHAVARSWTAGQCSTPLSLSAEPRE